MPEAKQSTIKLLTKWLVENIGWDILTKTAFGFASLETIFAIGVSRLGNSVLHILRTAPSRWQAIEISIVLELSLMLFVVFFLIGYRWRNGQQRKIFDFVDIGNFSWRYTVADGTTNETPHCKKHHMPLVEISDVPGILPKTNVYYCGFCERSYTAETGSVLIWQQMAKARVHATVFGYLRKDI